MRLSTGGGGGCFIGSIIKFHAHLLEAALFIIKETWLEISSILKTAFPDLNYHFKLIGAEGDVVRAIAQLSRTHTGPFDLTNMHMGIIPATDKAYSGKHEKIKITVKDNKITAWATEPTEGAGLKAILDQLGVTLPAVS